MNLLKPFWKISQLVALLSTQRREKGFRFEFTSFLKCLFLKEPPKKSKKDEEKKSKPKKPKQKPDRSAVQIYHSTGKRPILFVSQH